MHPASSQKSPAATVVRGGGVLFPISIALWAAVQLLTGGDMYPLFVGGLLLACIVAPADRWPGLPKPLRIFLKLAAMALLLRQLYMCSSY